MILGGKFAKALLGLGTVWSVSVGNAEPLSLSWADQVVGRVLASQEARVLVHQAVQRFQLNTESELTSLVRADTVSRVEVVLTRTWNTQSGKERVQRQVRIHLRRNQAPEQAALDLVHELGHAVRGGQDDPYDPHLTAVKYLWTALEGPGGEIASVMDECRVAVEWAKQSVSSHTRGAHFKSYLDRRCERYVDERGEVAEAAVRQDFYRVGKDYFAVKAQLGSEIERFPHLSAEPPALISSTGRAPYPVALLKEYRDLTQTACQNTWARLRQRPTREPASTREQGEMLLIKTRCTALKPE